jgi:hypothetical protein
VVQVDARLKERYPTEHFTLPEEVLRLAQAEYDIRYPDKQPYERMQERGGLSVLEIVGLLADHVERLKAGGK